MWKQVHRSDPWKAQRFQVRFWHGLNSWEKLQAGPKPAARAMRLCPGETRRPGLSVGHPCVGPRRADRRENRAECRYCCSDVMPETSSPCEGLREKGSHRARPAQPVPQWWHVWENCCVHHLEKRSWLPCGSDGKESACSAGDPGSIPGWARFPREGNGNPLQRSCLSQRVRHDWVTKHTHTAWRREVPDELTDLIKVSSKQC